MEYFPTCLSRAESDTMVQRLQQAIDADGWGFWAVERQYDARFIGFVGLQDQPSRFPFSPCVEIGWRLAYESWGQGYATEAAHRCLQLAFDDLGLTDIVSFTTRGNHRSQRVMQKLGMRHCVDGDFLHPSLAPDHPLAWHVLYRLTHKEWATSQRDK